MSLKNLSFSLFPQAIAVYFIILQVPQGKNAGDGELFAINATSEIVLFTLLIFKNKQTNIQSL